MTVHRSGARKSGLLGGPRPLAGLSVTIGCPASEVPASSAALLGWRHPLAANHRGKWAGDTTSAFGLPTSSAVGQFHNCPLCRFSELFCRPTKRPRENLPGCIAPAELCQLPRWVRHVTWEPGLGDRNDYVPSGHMCRHTLSEIRNALGLLKNDPGVVGGSGPGRFALVHDPRV